MSVTPTTPARAWAHAHRAALAIVLLGIALAATLGLLAARLADGSPAVPATSVPDPALQVTDNGCLDTRPGQPC